MKTIVFINKALGLLIFPLFLLYVFISYEKTPNMEYIYYPELIGFFNPEGIVKESDLGILIMVFVVLGCCFMFRFINTLAFIKETAHRGLARDISMNVSNILDLIYGYIFIKLALSIEYVEKPGFLIFTFIIMSLIFILWKIQESMMSSQTEFGRDNDEGAFNLRASVENYYEDKFDYDSHKKQLFNNYKKLTT